MKYTIQANPFNPVEYLACCGVFEILARFDSEATSTWTLDPKPNFLLESGIEEAALLTCLTGTLSDWSKWGKSGDENANDPPASPEEGEIGEESAAEWEEGDEGIRLTARFSLSEETVDMVLDWWYETLTPEKNIGRKSAWKMYAGQQTAEKISRDMTIQAAQLLRLNPVSGLTELIRLSTGMKGRFGFDPRSSRNALDAGYSANDLNLATATFPFAELLTTIGVQYFFPHRNQQGGGITSSRGWITKDIFRYALWTMPLPIQLARVAAIGAAANKEEVIPVRVERANRDKYSNFRMAKRTTWKDENGVAKAYVRSTQKIGF